MFKPKGIRTLCSFVVFFLVGSTAISQHCCDDKILKYPLKSITIYCQADTLNAYSEQILTYDLGRKLINSITYGRGLQPQIVDYKYHKDGLLESKEFSTKGQPIERIRIFEYDGHNRLAYDGFDDDKGNNHKNTYYYDANGILLRQIETCNGNKVEYSFNYDKQDRVIRKYKNNFLQTSFQYEPYGVSKEITYLENRTVETVYEYNYFGQLSMIVKNGKIIEKNSYKDGRLIKKLEYYYGTDPCFSACCSEYLITYEYY